MAHDVFISYSSKDKPTADAICAALEQAGIRCWIAPRDIPPGSDYGASIIDAIEGSRAMVLVFSGHANRSVYVKSEIERAFNYNLTILPFRIENVSPSRSLEFFLSTPHWLDALTPPLERHIRHLVATLTLIIRPEDRQPAAPPPQPATAIPPPPPPQPPTPPGDSTSEDKSGEGKRLVTGLAVIGAVVFVMAVKGLLFNQPQPGPTSDVASAPADDASAPASAAVITPPLVSRPSKTAKQAFSQGWKAEEKGDYATAKANYEIACKGGNAPGCTNLGYLYDQGHGVAQDDGQAKTYYEQACKGGNAGGCRGLGYLYENGHGVAQDYGQAKTYYERACKGKDSAGCYDLGTLYEEGRGVVKNPIKAKDYYEFSCKLGDKDGCTKVKSL